MNGGRHSGAQRGHGIEMVLVLRRLVIQQETNYLKQALVTCDFRP